MCNIVYFCQRRVRLKLSDLRTNTIYERAPKTDLVRMSGIYFYQLKSFWIYICIHVQV